MSTQAEWQNAANAFGTDYGKLAEWVATHGMPGQTPEGGDITPRDYDPAYGGVPNLPAYTTDTQTQTGPDKMAQLIAGQPDFLKNLGTYTGNIGANLAGMVSPGTTAQLNQQAMEMGVGSGMPLSSAATTGFLSRYGLTSEGLTQQGGKDYMGLMSAWPFQDQQTATKTTDLGAERAVYAAAPVPKTAAEQEIATAKQAAHGLDYNAWTANKPSGLYPMSMTQSMFYM